MKERDFYDRDVRLDSWMVGDALNAGFRDCWWFMERLDFITGRDLLNVLVS